MKNIIILAIAKLGFDKLKMTDKPTRARGVVSKVNGNPNFPIPIPSLGEITTAIAELQDALKELDGSLLNTAIKNEKEKALDKKMSSLRGYVQAASGGDETKILSAGFEVRGGNQRIGILDAVSGITLRPIAIPGNVVLKWKPVKKTKLYVVEYSLDGGNTWQWAGEVSKAKITFYKLPSGAQVSFRIACINSAGRSPWTNPISCKVY